VKSKKVEGSKEGGFFFIVLSNLGVETEGAIQLLATLPGMPLEGASAANSAFEFVKHPRKG
jgi:hypothetical protein